MVQGAVGGWWWAQSGSQGLSMAGAHAEQRCAGLQVRGQPRPPSPRPACPPPPQPCLASLSPLIFLKCEIDTSGG